MHAINSNVLQDIVCLPGKILENFASVRLPKRSVVFLLAADNKNGLATVWIYAIDHLRRRRDYHDQFVLLRRGVHEILKFVYLHMGVVPRPRSFPLSYSSSVN